MLIVSALDQHTVCCPIHAVAPEDGALTRGLLARPDTFFPSTNTMAGSTAASFGFLQVR